MKYVFIVFICPHKNMVDFLWMHNITSRSLIQVSHLKSHKGMTK